MLLQDMKNGNHFCLPRGKISPVHLDIPKPNRIQRLILRLTATRPVSSVLSRVLAPLDRFLLGLTSEKRSLTTILSGLPVIRLTTYGRHSGVPRICPLIPLPDEDKLVVFATNFGADRHPSWYLNLVNNPQVLVSLNGSTAKYIAQSAAEDERVRYWRQAVAMYPGYANYARRAGGRVIPIVVLVPHGDDRQ